MKIKFTLVLLLLSIATGLVAQKYTIDPGHSTVQIQVERFGVVDVVGRFKDVSGSFLFDANDITKTTAKAVIKVASYDANNTGGEDAVKSKAFLDVSAFPEITFNGTQVVQKEDVDYLIGDLTIHGVSNHIELPFTIKGPLLDLPTQKESIAFKASITINRQDYGIGFDRKLPNGTSLVGDEVKITLIILAIAE
jgi:polyisoprenoid-binding protein YceI